MVKKKPGRGPETAAWVLAILFLASSLVLLAWGWRLSKTAVVIVDWSTASELDTVGYNLYRSDQPGGEMQVVNPQLIPAVMDAQIGGDYSYQDTAVQAGKTYSYWLEDVASNGSTNRNGPVVVKAESNAWIVLASGLILFTVSGLIIIIARRAHNRIPHA